MRYREREHLLLLHLAPIASPFGTQTATDADFRDEIASPSAIVAIFAATRHLTRVGTIHTPTPERLDNPRRRSIAHLRRCTPKWADACAVEQGDQSRHSGRRRQKYAAADRRCLFLQGPTRSALRSINKLQYRRVTERRRTMQAEVGLQRTAINKNRIGRFVSGSEFRWEGLLFNSS